VLADAFFFLEVVEEDDLLFLFFSAALATASLCGNTIPVDGVATTRLVSVLVLAVSSAFSLEDLCKRQLLIENVVQLNDSFIYVDVFDYLSASIAAMSAGSPFLQVYQ
jgi:hypothetical protein